MRNILLIALATAASIATWTVTVLVVGSEGWLKQPIAAGSEPRAFVQAAAEAVAHEHHGNFSMVLLEDWRVSGSFHSSAGKPVGQDSVFQVASLGKWVAAVGVMTLVEDGLVDLDTPVSRYLTRWQLPESAFDNDGVTVRRLLSHTAGLDDGLGYSGFDDPGEVQALEDSLTRARDASSGKSGVVRVGHEPGSQWAYSGGGYTLLQLLIEEVSGEPFDAYMERRVFRPLAMNRTTFDHTKASRMGLAKNFRSDGGTEPFKHYSALAATSLFTTTADLAKFIRAHDPQSSRRVLSPGTLRTMREPHASRLGASIWGLGAMLFAPLEDGEYIVGHDGSNEPAINSAARLDPTTGNGIVIIETGSEFLATTLASEWVFWKTGKVDNLAFAMIIDRMLLWSAGGAVVILLVGLWTGSKSRRRKPGQGSGCLPHI